MIVDFPLPDFPTKATNCPLRISNDAPLKIFLSPKLKYTLSNIIDFENFGEM